MHVSAVTAEDPRVTAFAGLTDVTARSTREPAEGLFIAEGQRVITRAVRAGYEPIRVLTQDKWLPGLSEALAGRDVEVLVAPPDVLAAITGYRVHRGALAAMRRRPLPDPAQLVTGARFLLVLVDLVDHTNVGAAFRNAAALGADAVLVTPGCADPLYRRAVKVSMGAVLALPWTRCGADPLRDLAGLRTVALTPSQDAAAIDEVGWDGRRCALLLGTEGTGLPAGLLRRADVRVRIPMAGGVDSLNVAATSAIALYAMRGRAGTDISPLGAG